MNEQEIKAKLEELGRAFESFKAANDQRLNEIKASGQASADTISKVDKANADITTIRAAVDALSRKQTESETLLARIETLARRGDDEQTKRDRVNALAMANLVASRRKQPEVFVVTDEQVDQFRAYRRAFTNYIRVGDGALSQEIRAAMTIGTDPAGGYFVPPDMTGRIVELVQETSPLRKLATVSQTSRKEKTGRNDLNEVGGSWVAEQAEPGETTSPDIGLWKIVIHDQAAEPRATQDELDDADFDVDAWLIRKIANKLSRMEATAFVTGNGVTRPRGFTTYTHAVPSAAVWNRIEQVNTGAAGAFAAAPAGGDVFFDTIGKLKGPYRARAKWAFNRTTEAASRKLKDSDGAYLWQPGLQLGVPTSLAGYGIGGLFEDMATIAADSLSIALADWAEAYEIVDRKGITVVRDNLTAKPFIKFYTTRRVGGDVVNFEAIKLIKFAA